MLKVGQRVWSAQHLVADQRIDPPAPGVALRLGPARPVGQAAVVVGRFDPDRTRDIGQSVGEAHLTGQLVSRGPQRRVVEAARAVARARQQIHCPAVPRIGGEDLLQVVGRGGVVARAVGLRPEPEVHLSLARACGGNVAGALGGLQMATMAAQEHCVEQPRVLLHDIEFEHPEQQALGLGGVVWLDLDHRAQVGRGQPGAHHGIVGIRRDQPLQQRGGPQVIRRLEE